MGLTRFYPAPSDRLAIIWSLMPISDAVVLEYGPAGTTHFGGGFYSSLGIKLGKTLFTTHISEDDIVMGDVSRLENAISEVDKNYHPKIIFVVASAVIAVIGTDIAGVCNYMQERVNARLISFEEGGFRGDYTFGLRSVYRMLAREIIKPQQKEENACCILGASAGSYRIRSDVWEIKNLLREAFNIECRYTMGLDCTVEDIEKAGAAALNLVIREEAEEAAQIIEEKCGTPYIKGAPYGYKGTLEWLESISTVINRQINPTLVKRLREKQMSLMPMGGPMMMGFAGMPKKNAVLQGDYDTLLGFRTALSELGFNVTKMVCSHSLKAAKNPDPQVEYIESEKERIDLFKSLSDCTFFGSEELQRCVKSPFTLISAPFVSHEQYASHLPFMGERGMDMLRELTQE